MDICVLGMGYIGTTTAAALAQLDHRVTGVEKDPKKVEAFASGRVPFDEPGLVEAFTRAQEAGQVSVTDAPIEAIADADVIMICVGTPSTHSGEVDLTQVFRLVDDLAAGAGRSAKDLQIVAVRSTSPPGTTDRLATMLAEAAPDLGNRVSVVSNPEFLREGSALADFVDPPFTVIGSNDERAASTMKRVYQGVEGPVCVMEPEAAELLKYSCNAFHAIKVAFANEVGAIAEAFGVEPAGLMEAFVEDRKLNISHRYLMPGFAFGGSCLGKDVRGLSGLMRTKGITGPLIQSILPSNEVHLGRAVKFALSQIPTGTIGVAGLSFKEGTNDFRESPYVHLVRDLRANGRKVVVYEPTLSDHELMGANRQFMESVLPDYEDLRVLTPKEMMEVSEGVIVTRGDLVEDFAAANGKVLTFFSIGSFTEHAR